MDKIFFSDANASVLALQLPPRVNVQRMQRDWPGAGAVGHYESLVAGDDASLLMECNDDFLAWAHARAPGPAAGEMPMLLMPEDYHNLATSAPMERTVRAGQYRYNNTVPLYQRTSSRPYSRDDGGLRARELGTRNVSTGDMSLIEAAVNIPEEPDSWWGVWSDTTALDRNDWITTPTLRIQSE